MKLYGPSDVESIRLSDGHAHYFFKDAQRESAPGFGDDDRSLPFVDCAMCAEWCQLQGWTRHPNKVVKTADELEYEAETDRRGNDYMRGIVEGMGRMVAAKTEETETRKRTTRARHA